MKTLLRLLLVSVCSVYSVGTIHAQKNVQKSDATATRDEITADLKFGTGRTGTFLTGSALTLNSGSTLTVNGALAGTPTGGTVSLANLTLTLGTPAALTLTNATGLPIATGVSGLGTGVATFLATPSSANFAAAVTNETGSGALVFGTSPTLTTPVLGAATATSITAPALTPLTFTGGSSGAAVALGAGADGAIVVAPGSTTAANEYFTVNAATLTTPIERDTYALRGLLTVNNSALDYHSGGILGQVITGASSSGLNQWLAGVYGYFKHQGTTAASEAIGATGVITINGTGDITDGMGFKSSLSQQESTGRFVTARHYYAPPFLNPSGATKPTLLVGFDVADQGVDGGLASTVYAFRSAGNTPSSFSGPVTVGSLATSSTIRSADTTDATAADTGPIRSLGGISAAKQVFVGTRLVIDNSGTTNAKGIDFGNGAYIYRNQSGGIRITTTNQLYVEGDVVPTPTASYDIGGSSLKWRNAHFSGTVNAVAVSSAAGSNLVIGTGTFGTALTFTSATGAATFAGAVSVSGTTATWTSGTGSPESVKTAPVGSLYTRTDGGASTTLYVKESGAGNTGWVAK